jgi:hypothetical protein
LPLQGSARYSQFYFRVNGGSWYKTDWYYTHNAAWYHYDATVGWHAIGFGGGFLPLYDVTGYVEAWESRYDGSRSNQQWVYLGTCNAYSYHVGDGGIVFVGG